MRTKKSLWIIIAAFALCATPIQAQGFGSILKKAKKVLTPSSEPAKTETPQAKPAASNAAEEPIATGGTLINPLKDKVDVQLVGAYGKSTSENYGEVSLVLKVKMIANKNEISIGGNSNWPVMQRERATLFRMDSLLRLGRHLYENHPKRQQHLHQREEVSQNNTKSSDCPLAQL